LDSFLRGLAIPETVTGQEDILNITGQLNTHDIGVSSHSLVLGLHHRVVFVLKITECTGESEHSVDTAVLDEAIGVVDALAFLIIIGLVILR